MRWMLSALTGGLSRVIQATWLATSHRTRAFSSSATTKSFSLASARRDTASGTGPLWSSAGILLKSKGRGELRPTGGLRPKGEQGPCHEHADEDRTEPLRGSSARRR